MSFGDGVRVLIVDDHQLFTDVMGWTLANLGMEVVSATTAVEGLTLARDQRPDLVLMDIGLRDQNGLLVGKKILEELPETKVVAVTSHRDRRMVKEATRLGFRGYIFKDTPMRQFISAIRTILAGEMVLPGRQSRTPLGATVEQRNATVLVAQLTRREREVVSLLAVGTGSEEIAERLGLSPNTVRTHVQNILMKLQVHSRLEAAAFAIRYGLAKPERRAM